MKNDIYFKGIKHWGNLYVEHIFITFECEPILFTCINEHNDLYLVLCNEIRNEYKWIIAPISINELEKLINKEIDLYTAFEKNGEFVIATMGCDGYERYTDETIDTIDKVELPDRGITLRCNEKSAIDYLNKKIRFVKFDAVLKNKYVMCRYITGEQPELRNVITKANMCKCSFSNMVMEGSKYEAMTNVKYRSSCSERLCSDLRNMHFDAA